LEIRIEDLCLRLNFSSAKVLKAWKKFKIVKAAYQNLDESEFYKLTLSQDELKDLHPLLENYLALPLSTVNCERTFSRLNFVKTEKKKLS